MSVTNKGRALRDELNQAMQSEHDGYYIPFDRLEDCSLLARRAARYATRQEQACSYEWAHGDKWDAAEARLERSIRELAVTLPGVMFVQFTGDPRGYTVRLVLANGASNHWGRETWGIA